MKQTAKYVSFALIAIVGLLLIIALFFASRLELGAKVEPITYRDIDIGIAIPENIKVLRESGAYGFGEGRYFGELQLTEDDAKRLLSEAERIGRWQQLPLPNDVLMRADDLPKNIEVGIYFFWDRFAEQYPDMADKDYDARLSNNFTLALLDAEKNILYILSYDS